MRMRMHRKKNKEFQITKIDENGPNQAIPGRVRSLDQSGPRQKLDGTGSPVNC